MRNEQTDNISNTLIPIPDGKLKKVESSTNAKVKINAVTDVYSPDLRSCTINDAGCGNFSLRYTPELQFPFSNSDTIDDSH